MKRSSLVLSGAAVIIVIGFLVLSMAFGPGLFPTFHSGGKTGQSGGNSTKTGPATNPNLISVDTLVNYGNGTSIWYNETNAAVNSTFYSLTLQIANNNVRSVNEPPFGHFVTSINGVTSDGSGSNCNYCWGIWIYCAKDYGWMYSLLGADSLKLNNGDILAWYIHDISQNQPPEGSKPPVPACSA